MRRPRPILLGMLMSLTLLASGAPAQATESREPLDVRTFARVGDPGYPEGIAVARDGTVYVGTHQHATGGTAPSKIFAYTPDGRLKREYVVQGQQANPGILGMAFDGNGLLYVVDRHPARIFTLNPRTGAQRTYATFRDVPSCSASQQRDCSATTVDRAAFPDYPVFAPDGTMYVTDLDQALIWRIPRGGGPAEVWFTDPALDSVFGPNGVQLTADGHTLLFAQSQAGPPGSPAAAGGRLHTLPISEDGSPGALDTFWESAPGDFPDGFAIAESGNVYVALPVANAVLVLSPSGEELARTPAGPVENQLMEVPFDMAASVVFHGKRVLITNQAYFSGLPDHWAVLDVYAGEAGLPLHRPRT